MVISGQGIFNTSLFAGCSIFIPMERKNHHNKQIDFLTGHRVLFNVRFVNLACKKFCRGHLPIVKQELIIVIRLLPGWYVRFRHRLRACFYGKIFIFE